MENTSLGENNNTTTTSPTRIVRVNWLKFMYYSWKRISKFSRFLLIANLFFIIAQIATGIVILSLSTTESCDQPLETFIIIYIIKAAITIPFVVGHHFEKESRNIRMQRQRERVRRRQERERTNRRRRQGQDGNQQVLPSNASIASTIVEPRVTTLITIGQRFSALVDLFSILWFIVGNYMLFSSRTCQSQAPKLYFTTLAYLLINYFIIILPIIFCSSVLFCLPCVLVVMRTFHITEIDGRAQSERREEIKKVPIYRYKESSTDQTDTTQVQKAKKQNRFVRLFRFNRKQQAIDAAELGNYDNIVIHPKEDAVCCICLSEYEHDELVCKLWCGHHFHKNCVTEWLTMNSKCPLCKQDFRGKEYNDESDLESEYEQEIQMSDINSQHS